MMMTIQKKFLLAIDLICAMRAVRTTSNIFENGKIDTIDVLLFYG